VSAASVLLLGAVVVLVAALADAAALALMLPGALGRLAAATAANAAAGAIAWMEDAITASGAIAGAALGIVIYLGAGWEGWTMLAATFACAVITSNIGAARKRVLGVEEPNQGRRGARHAIANCAVAAGCAAAAIVSPHQMQAWSALVAALAAAGADTAASEIGKARAGRTVLVTTWRDVAPGTNGGVSVAGSVANVAAACALVVIAASLGLVGMGRIPALVAAALAGSLADSITGATLERRGIVDNDATNVINTAVAAGAAIYLSS
jgi:uncharacterized protein (TIGR00297 family)